MISIFLDLLEDCMEVFMDDFIVYVESFDACPDNRCQVLHRCMDSNLVLNFEKCHFMVTKGIVLGHLVSNRGIEVDKKKVDIIGSLSNPTFVREPCVDAFQELKKRPTSVAILQASNWEYPFKLMCDASNSMLGVVLGQRVSKQPHINYTITEKELLAIVFALEKFRSYLLGSKIIVISHHKALKFLLKKPKAKPRLIRWMLLLQKFDVDIKDKKGVENVVVDHLNHLERKVDSLPIQNEFLDEQILQLKHVKPWYADIYNFLVASTYPQGASRVDKERLETSGGGHYGSMRTSQKFLNYGLYWPTIFRDAHAFVLTYE
ncbi:Retrovirus-related Pol polyprotein from transposon 17.6, partial [Mucuna pruriens]